MVARRALALRGSLEERTHTALTLLHDVHHVPSFHSHLRCGALLVVGDGSVRLQDNRARDVCMGEVRDVPSPGSQCRNTLFQAGQEQPRAAQSTLPASSGPKPAGSQDRHSFPPRLWFPPSCSSGTGPCSWSGHLPWDSCPSPRWALLLWRQPHAPLRGTLPVEFFLASFGRRKTSGFLILDGSEQRQLNADQPPPPAAVPSLWAAASAWGWGYRITPKMVGSCTH